MHTTMDIALSRLTAQQRAVDVIANNIANADTPGFKAERMLFSTWLNDQHGTGAPDGDRALAYTQDRATYRDGAEGALTQTGNPLDVAVTGSGYFTVQTAQGVRLTRAGRFGLLADGTIADANGNALLDAAGQKLQVPPGDSAITIAGDGSIAARSGPIGRIGVVAPVAPLALRGEGGRLYDAPGGTVPVSDAHLVQGAVESSNVQPVLEVTRMMNQLREFQYMVQFVQSESDRMQNAIDKITKTS